MNTLNNDPQAACQRAKNIGIYQIYYDPKQRPLLEKEFEPYPNFWPKGSEAIEYREYFVFHQAYKQGIPKQHDLTGFLSWKFKQKTELSGAQFLTFIQENPGYDVYYVNPIIFQNHHIFANVWDQGEFFHPDLQRLTQTLFDRCGYDISISELAKQKGTQAFCNYWVATPAFWDAYMAFTEPLFKVVQEVEPLLKEQLFQRASKSIAAGYVSFIFERLFPLFLDLSPHFKAIAYTYPREVVPRHYGNSVPYFFDTLKAIEHSNYKQAERVRTALLKQIQEGICVHQIQEGTGMHQKLSPATSVKTSVYGVKVKHKIKAFKNILWEKAPEILRPVLKNSNALLKSIVYACRKKEQPQLIVQKKMPGINRLEEHLDLVFIAGENISKPGFQYRIIRYAEAATSLKLKTAIFSLSEVRDNAAIISRSKIIFIWRAAWDEDVAFVFHLSEKQKIKVFFDTDDLTIDPMIAHAEFIDGIRYKQKHEHKIQILYQTYQTTLLKSNFATASIESLAKHMRNVSGKPVWVLPNGYTLETFKDARLAVRLRKYAKTGNLVRIGYAAGTLTHQHDFELVAPALVRILREKSECRLVLFKHKSRQIVGLEEFPEFSDLIAQIEWRDQVPLEQLPYELARFDINLAPVEVGNPFCESKSELKFFEAALVSVPTIASPTEPFRLAIRENETGLLAHTEEEWYQAMLHLIEDQELRDKIGQSALHDVLWKYGPERRVECLYSILQQVLHSERAGVLAFQLDVLQKKVTQSLLPSIPDYEIIFESDSFYKGDVTILISLYNYTQYITEALESVKAQTYKRLDLVIVDDLSTDNGLTMTHQWLEVNVTRFNRIVLAKNKHNQGIGLTRNLGFALSETPFILVLDADNLLLPDCVRQSLATIQKTSASFVYFQIEKFGEKQGYLGKLPYMPSLLIRGNYIDAMALIRKSAWAAVGGYATHRLGWDDYELWCRFVECGFFGHQIPEVLAQYRVHTQSKLHQHTLKQGNIEELLTYFHSTFPWLSISTPSPLLSPTPSGQSLYQTVKKDRLEKMHAYSVDVIVCVHNALDAVRACMDSFLPTLGEQHRVIIVDDGSAAETESYLKERAQSDPRVTLLRNEQALRYTKAANCGLRKSRADFRILLNSDTVVYGDWILKLLDAAFSQPKIGIVGPLSNAAGHQSIPSIKGTPGQSAINPLPPHMGVREMNDCLEAWTLDNCLPRMPIIHGFCLGIRKEVIEAIGFLDEAAFPNGYGEENDYCLRAQDAGFDLLVATHTFVYHAKSKSYSDLDRVAFIQKSIETLNQKYSKERMKKATLFMKENTLLHSFRERAKLLYTSPPAS